MLIVRHISYQNSRAMGRSFFKKIWVGTQCNFFWTMTENISFFEMLMTLFVLFGPLFPELPNHSFLSDMLTTFFAHSSFFPELRNHFSLSQMLMTIFGSFIRLFFSNLHALFCYYRYYISQGIHLDFLSLKLPYLSSFFSIHGVFYTGPAIYDLQHIDWVPTSYYWAPIFGP